MSRGCFDTLDLSRLRQALDDFHDRVARHHGRIEITRDGCDDVCVLISKAELAALEEALDILSRTREFQSMQQHLITLASASSAAAASAPNLPL